MGNISTAFYPQSKGDWRRSTTKKHVRGNELERLAITIVESQLARHSSHRTFANWATKLGRNEEEGSRVGNWKFQLLQLISYGTCPMQLMGF